MKKVLIHHRLLLLLEPLPQVRPQYLLMQVNQLGKK